MFWNFAILMKHLLLLELFKEEINIIQQRHAVVFPLRQLKFIKAEFVNSIYELKFLDGYDLSTVITMVIQLAFKLVFNKVRLSHRK